jgi:hypothetical protein
MLENNFCGFLWAPIKKYYNDILDEINKKYPIFNYYIYKINDRNEFENMVLNIYKTDDIDPKKVKDIKLKSMIENEFIYFTFYIKNPTFRKKGNGNDICVDIENIKKELRGKYKSKVDNYIHDIIIHMCDNYKQNKEIKEIMLKYKYIEEYINIKYLIKCNYHNDTFKRVDMLVRKYSIEQYIKNNDYDFSLYLKMQRKRMEYKNITLNNIYWDNSFIILINELNNNYILNNPIEYENNFILRNGSHRLSYYYFKDITFIKTLRLNNFEGNIYCNYGYDWFQNKFTNDELNIISNEIKELENYMLEFNNKL